MPAQLLALNEGPSILLDKPILLLGRDLECDIRLDSRKISRRHCCIAQVGEQLVVRDLGSTNGIRVNGLRVQEGHLNAGDELTIGNYRYRVRWEGTVVQPARDRERPEGRAPECKPPVAHAPGTPEDEMLESCDEPMPLAEPADGAVAAPRARGLPPREDSPSPYPTIIPDSLELAPNSDHVLPDPGVPPRPSSPPYPPVAPESSDSFHMPPT